jgi:hypothetical protein
VPELEVGQWVTDATTVSIVGSYAAFSDTEPYGDWAVQVGTIGARVVRHDRSVPMFVGYGFGATLSREIDRLGSPERRDVSHYIEGIAGMRLGHVGPIAFDVSAMISLGEVTTVGATLGAAWDSKPPLVRCPEPSDDYLIGALRAGFGYGAGFTEDSFEGGWGPAVELDVGAPNSIGTILGVASFAQFTGLQPYGSSSVPETIRSYRLGVREELWPTRRAFIAPGLGFDVGTRHAPMVSSSDTSAVGVYVDLVLGVQLVRLRHFSIEATSHGSLSFGFAATSFALGAAWR